MALVSDTTRRIDLPHEDGAWVELRQLSGRQLRKIQKAKMKEAAESLKLMGPELMGSLSGFSSKDLVEADKDPLAEYDIDALLEAGIVAWSYEEEVDHDTIGLLDQETETFIALALIGVEEEEAKVKGS